MTKNIHKLLKEREIAFEPNDVIHIELKQHEVYLKIYLLLSQNLCDINIFNSMMLRLQLSNMNPLNI